MLRLPRLRYVRPSSPREAAAAVHELGGRAMLVAGGTDLYPKLKRRQFDADTLVGLTHLDAMRGIRGDAATGVELGGLV
ncbi:MAG: FAD binding domain-containing protein, partial [Candidatus Dormibacteraeota bacterium]|nr:FAD binding domain-containing protein [Candidatus Dormibacteraeota bacterium]